MSFAVNCTMRPLPVVPRPVAPPGRAVTFSSLADEISLLPKSTLSLNSNLEFVVEYFSVLERAAPNLIVKSLAAFPSLSINIPCDGIV